jgi:acyl-CoA thioester hydrolase
MSSPVRTPLREVARVRVIYADTDQMGMVYYGTYLRYFEVARNEYLRAAGASYRAFSAASGLHLPVVEAHAKYHRLAQYDDELVISTALGGPGRVSVRFDYQIHRAGDGELVASGWTVHACINAEGRVVRIPPAMRDAVGLGAGPGTGAP